MRSGIKLANASAAVWMALVLLISGWTTAMRAEGVTGQIAADEYSLKAAFLYNLAKFLDWPAAKCPEGDSPIIVGVDGVEALDKFNAVLKNKLIGKHNVLVRLVESPADAKDCHILFITRIQSDSAAKILSAAAKSAALTVGETDKFLDDGGMIRFYQEGDNLRLEIDNEAIRGAELTVKGNALSTLVNKGIVKLRKI